MKPGQKVVCVKTSERGQVIKNEIYTIKDLHYDSEDDLGLILYEVKWPIRGDGTIGYAFTAKLFRLVDYTFGENIEEFIKEVVYED